MGRRVLVVPPNNNRAQEAEVIVYCNECRNLFWIEAQIFPVDGTVRSNTGGTCLALTKQHSRELHPDGRHCRCGGEIRLFFSGPPYQLNQLKFPEYGLLESPAPPIGRATILYRLQ